MDDYEALGKIADICLLSVNDSRKISMIIGILIATEDLEVK